ncbi:Hsp33 chaperonin [Robbsia andropogonis]|uniref:Hsp33 chaperonin n=1 Tax=Robbsia andropogonis TaxID=28092 RepID=A0A0F5JXC5_9BURK|nr:Hsp33 family molecular chaperone HslO [Robbsia andropogonis]KKB62488.1 Hsp33 chaperonin [Robbsia andropogonis]MCP1120159.1 Hsp33 family molecular chaperone HslO [Robbsia andropogonis]MCP1130009.1 Hsp33 family molecular chaperone HslO [Robbsia andropogonis]
MNDQLERFMFEAGPVRGEYVSLKKTWRDVLDRRDYPAPVRAMLGEMMAASALLSANLKFDGALVMQIHGDGPVKMLVVQCNSDLSMRATAKLAVDVTSLPENATMTELVNLNGQGRCAITLDPREKLPGQQPYQGIVPLSDDDGPITSIGGALEYYMQHSEQLDTRLWLAADSERAVGVLLQKMPGTGGHALASDDGDTWDRVCALAGTLKQDEMLSTEGDTLMHRLFWEERRAHADSQPTRFACGCSREKVGGMLTMLGRAEVDDILDETGEVEVHCEFCNERYVFDRVDAVQLFTAPIPGDVSPAPEQRH